MTAADSTPKTAASIAAALAWAASVATVVGLVLALLGYGVALAAEATLGVPHALLFDSSFELVDLAAVAVVQVITNGVDAIGRWELYGKVYALMWPLMLGGVGAWLLFAAFIWWRRKGNAPRSLAGPVPPPTAARGTGRPRLLYATAVVIGGIGASPLLLAVLLVAVMSAGAVLSFIPLAGMSAGQAYIKQWVFEPAQCVPTMNLLDRTQRPAVGKAKPANAAQCVIVSKDDKELGRGRVVFATNKALILFEPNSGAVVRVPTGDALVRLVGSL